jgi:Adenylate cyclase, family 3 (some proteins contain HAMP domain)
MDGGGSADEYRPPDGAEIKTFLIADVRGYTMFTNERGDEAAAKLAAKFAAIVREGVEARGGSLVELRGDEGLAVFSSARQAIRAAMDLQSAFVDETLADPSLPLLVGIGLDAGEAVAVEGGYRGGALNLAARLCGQAGPGETLASQEVVHLARKVEGVRYVERGAVHLKGLDQPVLVIRVMLEEGDPAERLAGVVTTPSPVRRARPRRTVVLVAAVATIALVAATLPFVLHHDTPVPALAANGIQLIDATSGQRVGSVPLPGSPGGIASGGGSVWVSDPQAGTVVRLDPSTRAAVDTIPVGRDPAGIAFGDGAVWVAVSGDGELARIDPSTDTVVSRVGVGNGPTGVAVSSGFVWVTNYTTTPSCGSIPRRTRLSRTRGSTSATDPYP